jgi:3-deoxy-D-manno-octulosonate 8-phosphate phosphatase KdsC-like HAD superfamily phosphatase
MVDEEKSEIYSKLKDYPEIIKGVEDDSSKLIETQNEAMNEQFGNMRSKISQSLDKLHLGVIQKTVDKVVQNILTTDLQKINENINTQFMMKFNQLLGNLITNVDEVINVGKILDAVEAVNEYVDNFNFDDAIALLEITIALITQSDLKEQKKKLIERRVEVLEIKEEYNSNIGKLKELEKKLKDYNKKYLLNEAIATLEEIVETAPLVGKLALINKYAPVLESTKKELAELTKDTIVANENFDVLVKSIKIPDAHETVEIFKKKWYLYLKKPPVPLITKLTTKDKKTWDKFTKRQKEITDNLGELKSEINSDISKMEFLNADEKWESARELLDELYDEKLKDNWEKFEKDYLMKKKDRFDYLYEKIKKYEEKFNENYYKYYLHAALNYCERIIEIAPQVGEDELVEKYTKLKEEIQIELDDLEAEFLKELEELESNRKELEGLIEIEEDVLPLLDKFAVEDVLDDVTADINESLDQVKSFLIKNRVEVKGEIANRSIMKSATGEMIEAEGEISIDKLGEEDTESISFNAQSVLKNPFEDSIEEAILTDVIPYNFEITNIEINGKPVEQLPDKTLTKDGLELKWQLENIPPKEKLEIRYDLRRRVSRTIIFVLEGEIKIVKTHSTLNKLQMEGFYDAALEFTNSYGSDLSGVIIEDIIPLYYLHIIKEPTAMLPAEQKESKMGELIKWDIGDLEEKTLDHRYRLLELYRYEEIKMAVDSLNKDFIKYLDKGQLNKAVERYHEMGGMLEEYHTHD